MDRGLLFRFARSVARSRMATSRAWRSYCEAFADALRREWQNAKATAVQAQVEAEEASTAPLSAEVADHCRALRLEADYAPYTAVGHARFRALHAEAEALELAARLMMIPTRGFRHVAH